MTIWKWTLSNSRNTVSMPEGARILAAQTQFGVPCIWALVDPSHETEERTFALYGTGHPFDEKSYSYIGTIQLQEGAFIFHVFEVW